MTTHGINHILKRTLLLSRPSKAIHVLAAILLDTLLNSTEAVLDGADKKKLYG